MSNCYLGDYHIAGDHIHTDKTTFIASIKKIEITFVSVGCGDSKLRHESHCSALPDLLITAEQ